MMVEALFFPAILPPLLMVYRCRHYQEELATAKNMCYHANVTPKDLSVRRKFWLAEQVQVDNVLVSEPDPPHARVSEPDPPHARVSEPDPPHVRVWFQD